MHELSLAQALVEQVEGLCVKENADAVLSVTVNIGALSGVNRESFEFAFPLAVEGTRLKGATLKIEETPAVVTCEQCGQQTQPPVDNVQCMQCGSRRVGITAGRDFLIQSVELRAD